MIGDIEGVTERVGVVERNMADTERWDTEVKGALTQLLVSQRVLQDYVTEMEGHCRNTTFRVVVLQKRQRVHLPQLSWWR